MNRFENKDIAEKVVLAFDFADALERGESLAGSIIVTVAVEHGTDASPTGILNGAAEFDDAGKQVLQAVQAGVSGVIYRIKVVAPTSNPKKVLALTALLPVVG